jgi:hypothetical protein
MIIYQVNQIFLIPSPMYTLILEKLKRRAEEKFLIVLVCHKVEH